MRRAAASLLRAALAAGAVAGACLAGAAVGQAINAGDQSAIVHGCSAKTDGLLRIVEEGVSCDAQKEVALDWARAGRDGPHGQGQGQAAEDGRRARSSEEGHGEGPWVKWVRPVKPRGPMTESRSEPDPERSAPWFSDLGPWLSVIGPLALGPGPCAHCSAAGARWRAPSGRAEVRSGQGQGRDDGGAGHPELAVQVRLGAAQHDDCDRHQHEGEQGADDDQVR